MNWEQILWQNDEKRAHSESICTVTELSLISKISEKAEQTQSFNKCRYEHLRLNSFWTVVSEFENTWKAHDFKYYGNEKGLEKKVIQGFLQKKMLTSTANPYYLGELYSSSNLFTNIWIHDQLRVLGLQSRNFLIFNAEKSNCFFWKCLITYKLLVNYWVK